MTDTPSKEAPDTLTELLDAIEALRKADTIYNADCSPNLRDAAVEASDRASAAEDAWEAAGFPRPRSSAPVPPANHVRVRMAVAVWGDGDAAIYKLGNGDNEPVLAQARRAIGAFPNSPGHLVMAEMDVPLPPPTPSVVGSVSDE